MFLKSSYTLDTSETYITKWKILSFLSFDYLYFLLVVGRFCEEMGALKKLKVTELEDLSNEHHDSICEKEEETLIKTKNALIGDTKDLNQA